MLALWFNTLAACIPSIATAFNNFAAYCQQVAALLLMLAGVFNQSVCRQQFNESIRNPKSKICNKKAPRPPRDESALLPWYHPN